MSESRFEERRRRDPREWAARLMGMALLLAIVALGVFGMLADEVFEGDTLKFDLAVRNGVHAHASPGLTQVMRGFSFLGSAAFLGAATIVLVAVFLLLSRKSPPKPTPGLGGAPSKLPPRWRRAAALLTITMAGDVALETMLKELFRRPRPEAFFGTPLPDSYSFPSGHAMASFCFYLVLAGMMAHRVESRKARAGLWVGAAILAAGIGFSRIYLGVHWPTDVIAGYAAAAVWVGTVVTVDGWRARRNL